MVLIISYEQFTTTYFICSAEPPDVALVIAQAASFLVRNSAVCKIFIRAGKILASMTVWKTEDLISNKNYRQTPPLPRFNLNKNLMVVIAMCIYPNVCLHYIIWHQLTGSPCLVTALYRNHSVTLVMKLPLQLTSLLLPLWVYKANESWSKIITPIVVSTDHCFT